MKTNRRIAALTALLLAAGLARGADAGGKWKAEFDSPIGHLKYTYDLKADGDKLTGKAIRDLDGEKTEIELKEGKISGDQVSFVELIRPQDQEIRIEYTGKLAGNEIKFTRKVGDFATMDVVAKRDTATGGAPASGASPVAGQWLSEFDTQIGKQKYIFTFKVEGDKLTGKANAVIGEEKLDTELKEGKVNGDEISFVEPLNFQGTELRIEYKGKLAGDEIKFTRKVGDVATEELVAKRGSASTAGAAQKVTLKVVKVDSEETVGESAQGTNAVDGNPTTFWHTEWNDSNPRPPHEIILELIPPSRIHGFTYLPRQDAEDHGNIRNFEFYVSDDGKEFGAPVKKGAFIDAEGKGKKTITFEAKTCRFIKLKALSEINDEAWTSAAEIDVIAD